MFWLKKVRRFEKFGFKYRIAKLVFEYLQSWKQKHLIPKFFQFKVANRCLGSTKGYFSCQKRVWDHEVSFRHKTIRPVNDKITPMKNDVHNETSFRSSEDVSRNFFCLILGTSLKFIKARIRNFMISFSITVIINL